MPVPTKNPCISCGACCAHYRVSFFWAEAEEDLGGNVPVDLTEDLNQFLRCMKNTNQKQPRCIALEGEVGENVRCAIYDRRPESCREYGVTWANHTLQFIPGELARCNQARAAWNLPPLTVYPRHHTLIKPSLHVLPPKSVHRRRKTRGGIPTNYPSGTTNGVGF